MRHTYDDGSVKIVVTVPKDVSQEINLRYLQVFNDLAKLAVQRLATTVVP